MSRGMDSNKHKKVQDSASQGLTINISLERISLEREYENNCILE